MDWLQTSSWFSTPCSNHVFLETGVRGMVWPYRKRGMKRGAWWSGVFHWAPSDTQVDGAETADPQYQSLVSALQTQTEKLNRA